jgi:serine/threonine protein kinase
VHVIAMPFIENGDLFEWINQHGSFNEDAGRYFAKKLIGTFRYLASQHVCHRDIKPENILLNHHYEPLILDFGLSMDSRHKASNFVSDLRFSSP